MRQVPFSFMHLSLFNVDLPFQHVSWLPIAYAAKIITEVLWTDIPSRYLHLVHPHRARFIDLVRPIASSLDVPIIPYNDWLDKLRVVAGYSNSITSKLGGKALYTSRDIRVLALVEYFGERDLSGTSDKWQDNEIDIAQMTLHSSSMSSALPPLGEIDARRWLTYWVSVGLL
jgi:hypothetical protein